MIRSMTGFASATGSSAPQSWSWELRSVNGKGLDIRVRAPDWIDGLEAGLRKRIGTAAARGNITCNLRLSRKDSTAAMTVNAAQLQSVLSALSRIETEAMDAGVSLAPSKASDIVALRGVLEQSVTQDDGAALAKVLLSDFEAVVQDFDAMRASEGAALVEMLGGQLDEVEQLTAEAATLAEARKDEMAATPAQQSGAGSGQRRWCGRKPHRTGTGAAGGQSGCDRRDRPPWCPCHCRARPDRPGGPIGRKFDFLMQEFNREANTLCSKAQNSALTAVGLALKALIDQMREQVQNVE